jgi:nucleoid-associated protein YgaU
MSKHEKYGDPRVGEEHEGQTSAQGNDTFDDLEGAEDLVKTGLTVGKEVRIGLAVIVVLVIVLGAVIVKRMRHTAESKAKPAAEEHAASAEKPGATHGKDAVFRPEASGFGSASRSGKPTVVAALSGPGPETKPKSPRNEPDTWAFASDTKPKGDRDKGEGHFARLPSFMPKVADAAPVDRSVGLTGVKPAARTPGGWVNDRDTASSATGQRAADPFQGRSLAAAERGPRISAPLAPSVDPRAPLAPSASNPLRGRDNLASARSGEQGAGARALSKLDAPPAARNARDEFAPRFGEAGPSSPPGGLALRSDASPPPGDAAARRPDGTYVVQPNDNYWTISQRLFGTGAYFQALAQHNRSKYPRDDKLQAGDAIVAPTAAELEKLYPQLCPAPTHREAIDTRARTAGVTTRGGAGRVYVVQEGDTLYDIARYELGKASRWGEIYELNKDTLGKQFDYLSPGMQLVLPEGGPTISQRKESSPRR